MVDQNEGDFVVNDALGLAQFITQHMNEARAVAYLASIDALTLEHWRFAKSLVSQADKTKRHSKENSIKDIVVVFQNNDIETKYLVGNLSLCAGFQSEFLKLANYTASSVEAAKAISLRITAPTPPSYSLPSPEVQGESTPASSNSEQSSSAFSSHSYPSLNGESSEKNAFSAQLQAQEKGKWPRTNSRGYVRRENSIPQGNSILPKSRKTDLQGTGTSKDGLRKHQSKFICLGVRSGCDETVETLSKELEDKWKGHTSLVVEAVSKTEHSSTFRVQMNLPASLYNQLENPNMWPARMSAFRWRGNPRQKLRPLEERPYTKKIYVGNLHKDLNVEKVNENMKRIYQEEINSGLIDKIETIINHRALERANQIVSRDQSKELRQSVCVVLTSHPGKSLMNVSLKLDHFPHYVRRWVRPWRGPAPRQEQIVEPVVNLEWQ